MWDDYFTALLGNCQEVPVNVTQVSEDWKKATVIPIHKGGNKTLAANYRPISLTSVVCKQMEQAIASYMRQV